MVETGRWSAAGAAIPLSEPIAVIAAVPREVAPLEARLKDVRPTLIGRKVARVGLLAGTPVIVLAAGMGKTNASHGLTALLENHRVRGVLNVGIAGAYPGSGLKTGELALASEEIYGDEGVSSPEGWQSAESIGIPLLQTETSRLFNHLPLDAALVERAHVLLEGAGLAAAPGRFVTVSCCSGTSARGAEIAARFGALCESMEGAALAHVSLLYDTPFLEMRAVSNLVEDRDLSRWRLREAIETACRAVPVVLRAF